MSTNPSTPPGAPFDRTAIAGNVPEGPIVPELAEYRRTLLGSIDERYLDNHIVRAAAIILLGAALLIPSIQFVVKIQKADVSLYREGGERLRTALGRWLPTAELMLDPDNQVNPYGMGHWFPTPPLVLLSIAPLTRLGVVGAAIVWSAGKIVAVLVGLALTIRGIGRASFAVPIGVLLMAMAYSVRPIVSDISHGNLNIFMMAWLAIAWGLFVRRFDFCAGLFLALAVVTKLTPALALVYFAYKRQWRVLIGAAVGMGMFFIVIPGLILGFEKNWHYLKSWFDMLVAPFALHGYAAYEPANQSLFGVVMRLFGKVGILQIEEMPVDMAFNSGMEDMARPATSLGRLLKPAISLPIFAVLAWVCRTPTRDRRDPRLLLEFSMILLAMLLLSERTWKHHATTLPIVFIAVWYVLTCRPLTERFRAWFVAGLSAQLVLLVLLSEGILRDRLAERLLDYGVFCWGLLLCFIQAGLLIIAVSAKRCSTVPSEYPEPTAG
ncbi:MAG: DUF2029 domain-containing protein [Phycisphaerae bacterium]|nr:DUF2029 domain-containing protein [Phycisphaerae bacterium]